MPERHFPVRPDLDQLRHQAKDLLAEMRRADPAAKLADAQLALAKQYGIAGWPRLVLACRVIDAIWEDDLAGLRDLVTRNPHLVHEMAGGTTKSNWGAPMSYAANLGRDRIIAMLHELGATDHEFALGRAMLQGKIATGRLLHAMMGSPKPPDDALGGPAYTLSVSGTAFALELGARVRDDHGNNIAPVDVVLETDSRRPDAKHAILALYAEHGYVFPDTPTMALHRGRLDLLEQWLRRDPALLGRTFAHEEIYPPELGCHDEINATQGTPLKGTTLLHLCVDYDEWEIARWLLERGMDVNTRAAVDHEGFGGHTALFGTVVSQPNFWVNHGAGRPDEARFTRLLLDHGADTGIRASLRKQLHPGYDDHRVGVYRDVTALEWGERFHGRIFVSAEALRLIAGAGGGRGPGR